MTKRKEGSRPGADYEVGYGKPPKEHQFKKGNKAAAGKRRAKKQDRLEEVLFRLLNEKIPVMKGDRKVSMSRLEALLRSALGDPRKTPRDLLRLLEFVREMKLDEQFLAPSEEQQRIVVEFVGRRAHPAVDTTEAGLARKPLREQLIDYDQDQRRYLVDRDGSK